MGTQNGIEVGFLPDLLSDILALLIPLMAKKLKSTIFIAYNKNRASMTLVDNAEEGVLHIDPESN